MSRCLLLVVVLCCASALAAPTTSAPAPRPATLLPASTARKQIGKLIDAARAQIGTTVRYDPAYRSLAYPRGDVPADRGVCSDVVIRALRQVGVDLQVRVHEDMWDHFRAYPALWGLKAPDPNIDHRRVPNLETYFGRHGMALPVTRRAAGEDVLFAWPPTGHFRFSAGHGPR